MVGCLVAEIYLQVVRFPRVSPEHRVLRPCAGNLGAAPQLSHNGIEEVASRTKTSGLCGDLMATYELAIRSQWLVKCARRNLSFTRLMRAGFLDFHPRSQMREIVRATEEILVSAIVVGE